VPQWRLNDGTVKPENFRKCEKRFDETIIYTCPFALTVLPTKIALLEVFGKSSRDPLPRITICYIRAAILFSKLTSSLASVNPRRGAESIIVADRRTLPRRGLVLRRLLYDDSFGNKLVVNSADNSSRSDVNLHYVRFITVYNFTLFGAFRRLSSTCTSEIHEACQLAGVTFLRKEEDKVFSREPK